MLIQNTITRFLLIALCASLPACATKVPPEVRASVRSIRLNEPVQSPKSDYYMDQTIQSAEVVGSQFGLVGALVCGGIAAADQNAGLNRWAPITTGHSASVQKLVCDHLSQEFTRSANVRCGTPGPVDATLSIKQISYGVTHCKDQRFKAVTRANVALSRPDGKVLWKHYALGTSLATFTQGECASQPGIYSDALQEASRSLAEKLVAGY